MVIRVETHSWKNIGERGRFSPWLKKNIYVKLHCLSINSFLNNLIQYTKAGENELIGLLLLNLHVAKKESISIT